MDDSVRYSYCTRCIDRQNFVYVDGTWLCEKCNKPLQKATQPVQSIEKSLQSKDLYGTIVSGINYE